MSAEPVTLTEEQLVRLADLLAERTDAQLVRFADLLAERLRPDTAPARPTRLVSAGELAELVGVEVKTVYRRVNALAAADGLAVVRVGRRLSFDVERALAAWSAGGDRLLSERSEVREGPAPAGSKARRRSMVAEPDCRLLPVGRVGGVQ